MALLELAGKGIRVVLNDDLSLTVLRRDGRPLWESSRSHTPAVVAMGGGESRTLPLASASDVSVSAFSEGRHSGHSVRLGGFEGLDVCLELALAIDGDSDELLIQVAQVGGGDTVNAVRHLYRFEKPVADGGYMVLPHGSGYLIPADCPDELPGEGFKGGFIGARWTMPLFGIVRGEDSLCVIVDTWWDCDVEADHVPGEVSALDFHWAGSLGKLAYPRRQLIRFSDGMDYAAMAKLYRSHAAEQGLVRTLEEKSDGTPVIRRYVENILFRWPAWNTEDGPAVLAERPTDRYKVVEVDGERVIRFAHPELDLLQHTVNVYYKVLRLRDQRVLDEVNEVHPMRFLFPQEVRHYLEEAGFQVRTLCPFLHLDAALSEHDWSLAVVAEAQ